MAEGKDKGAAVAASDPADEVVVTKKAEKVPPRKRFKLLVNVDKFARDTWVTEDDFSPAVWEMLVRKDRVRPEPEIRAAS